MNRDELKQTLAQQAASMEEDVFKKLHYLMSDDVFSDNGNADYIDDADALQYAFQEQLASDMDFEPTNDIDILPGDYDYTASQNVSDTQSVTITAPTDENLTDIIEDRKQNVAAKIAALRGISLPGDYLKKKF